MSNQLMTIKIMYGRENKILDIKSINLTPAQASELSKTISVLVCGYPELEKLEQPENVVEHQHDNFCLTYGKCSE